MQQDLFRCDGNFVATISRLYQRTEDDLNDDVATLKQWMTTQLHLPEILDDKPLQNFLIFNKCSIEKAKTCIDMYYTLRSRLPELYETQDPTTPELKEVLRLVCWVPLPKLNPDNHRVMIFKLKNKQGVEKLEPKDVLALAGIFQEVRLREDVMFGDVFVYDMQGLTLGYLTKLTPSFLAKAMTIYVKVFSIPLKSFYIVNSSPYVTTLLAIVKTLMKPKIFERVHVCQDTSILKEKFPKEMLPRDYGGDERSTEELQELLLRKFEQHQGRFEKLKQLHVNEDLRPRKLENDELLGFHGSFKKLSVD